MEENFQLRETNRSLRNTQKLNLKIRMVNQVTFGSSSYKSFRSSRPDVNCKKGVLKKFAKLGPATLLKNRF